jgi:cytochrome c-type biogenesis protein CcmH
MAYPFEQSCYQITQTGSNSFRQPVLPMRQSGMDGDTPPALRRAMEFLIIAVSALVVVVGALGLFPHRARRATVPQSGSSVYREQLEALDRDLGAGSVPAAEADSLRVELSRRLIEASKQEGQGPDLPAISPLLFALFIPLIVAPIYWHFGKPAMADTPLAQRVADAVKNNDFEGMLAQVEKHLAEKPDDVAGWKVVAQAYTRFNRFDDAAQAYLKIATLQPPTADILSSYGENLVFANKGLIPKLAAQAFEQALTLDPTYPKARFFSAMAMKQDGKTAEAKAAYEKLLADAPPDAKWRKAVESELASMGATPPALNDQQVKDGSAMAPADQSAMIHSMVDGLEQKLVANPDDLEGWLKLIRARIVLTETDKAKAALDKANAQFKDKPEALAQIKALADEFGLK